MVKYIKKRWRREPNADIRRLYLATALRCGGFYLPIIVLYNREVMGLSFAQFMFVEAFFAVSMAVLEIPTGYFSDIWQRRTTMIVSAMFWAAAYIWMSVAYGLFDALGVQLLMALGASFSSGTLQAMLYEYLAEEKREHEYRKAEGRRFALGFYGLAFTAPAAGWLYSLDVRLAVILTLGLHLASLLVSLHLREPVRLRRGIEHNAFYDMLKTMRYALYGHREIAAIILLSAIMLCGTKLILWIQQPYYQAAHIPLELYGWLSAGAFLLVAVNSQLVHRLEHWMKPVPLLGLIMLTEIALTLLTGVHVAAVVAPLLLVGQALYGLANPVITDIIIQRSDPARRATILSAQSLSSQFAFTLVSVPYGILSDSGTPGHALLGLSCLLTLCGVPAWLYLCRKVPD